MGIGSREDAPRGVGVRAATVFAAVLLFFFVSGACGLLYQVVWTRKLVLLFGTTSYAVSTVLSIFFLGLAVGSLWGGRLADRSARPLFLYGVFEILIGAWALAFILFVDQGEAIVVGVLRVATSSRPAGIGLRAFLALAFLIVPVTLMGATLPLLAKFVGQERRVRGLRIGALYSINTFGAVAGCAFTGFVLIAALGYTRTTLLGAATNGVVGVLAVLLSRRPSAPAESNREEVAATGSSDEGGPMPPWLPGLVVAAFAVSGCCALALEVLWTRMLAIVFLGTTYAFTTMLASLLCGIAAGSAFASGFVDRRHHPVALFGVVELLIGLSCLATLSVFEWLPGKLVQWQVDVGFEWARLVRVKFLLSFAALFVPTFLFGMTFPIVVRAVTASGSRLGRDVGRLYSANTFGGVVGAILGGFVLIPTLGTQNGIVVLGLILFGLGVILVLTCPTLRPVGVGSAAAIVPIPLGIAVWASGWDGAACLSATASRVGAMFPLIATHTGMAVGGLLVFAALALIVFVLPLVPLLRKAGALALAAAGCIVAVLTLPEDVSHALNRAYLVPGHEEIYYCEGVEGTVVVAQPADDPSGSNRVLYINGVQATASIEKGVKMNRLQGVLPLLFNREPRAVLFMCFGSGITAGTLGLSDFDRIDAVEISREVLDAAHLFKADNLNIIENPKVQFIVDDGRNFLLTTGNRYDVITFEPMPLALAGVSTFYTHEYYELCKARLNPGGLVSQWVPLHSLNLEVVQSLVLTFTQVFPEHSVWFVNADLFLIGSDEPLQIDYAGAASRTANPLVRKALHDVGFMDLPELLTCFFMSNEGLAEFVAGTVMHDDRPWAEFEAPKLVYAGGRSVAESLARLKQLYESPVEHTDFDGLSDADAARARRALDLRYRAKTHDLDGLELYYGGMVGSDQERHFKAALAVDANDFNARYYLKQLALQRTALYLRWREFDQAQVYLEDLLQYMPGSPELLVLLGDVYFDSGRIDLARATYAKHLAAGGAAPRAVERTR
jgi:spermidine synthase